MVRLLTNCNRTLLFKYMLFKNSPGKLPLLKQRDHDQPPEKEESGTECQGEELLAHFE